MLFRVPKTRKFRYIPYYYDERKDHEVEEGGRRRIQFRRSPRLRQKKRSFIWLIALLVIVLLFLQYLNQYRVRTPEQIDIPDVEIVK
jgi:hypothetical protein